MEGISGVVHPDDVEPGTPSYAEFRQVMTDEVNAAAQGLYDGGATDVVVNDAHYTMRNLVVTRLDPRVTYIRGSQKPLGMMQGLLADTADTANNADTGNTAAVDAVVLLGYHAGAGQPGVLAHCYLGNSIVDVRIDGVSTSEGRMNALLAAEYGVPVILVTGDDLTCQDAQSYSPGVRTAVVKWAIDRYCARTLVPSAAQALIREEARAAADACRHRPTPGRLTRSDGPYAVDVDFDAAHLPRAAARIPGVEATGVRTATFRAPSVLELVETFRLLSGVVSAATLPEWG
jgi:D-amino peptidase